MTIYEIANHLGIALTHKNPQHSPFRNDKHPSFSIFNNGKNWKDHATGESGGLIAFYCKATQSSRKDAIRALASLSRASKTSTQKRYPAQSSQPQKIPQKISIPEIFWDNRKAMRLSAQRGFNIEALRIAFERGCFGFCRYYNQDVWIVTDKSRFGAQVRRLDGNVWNNGSKAITLKGTNSSYPTGIAVAYKYKYICVCEGSSDFLAAFHFAYINDVEHLVAPVAMLGANQQIGDEFLAKFEGKEVLIIPDHDPAGKMALRCWGDSISEYARNVYYFDFGKVSGSDFPRAKDLCDFIQMDADQWERIRPYDSPFINLIKEL